MKLFLDAESARELVKESFVESGLDIQGLEARTYPDDTIFVVYVKKSDFGRAVRLGNELDSLLSSQGFVGIVSVREGRISMANKSTFDLADDRVSKLMDLLVARSRVSEVHPSLSYVPDIAGNTAVVQSQRHHLVFGRRGVGKTALLVEGRRLIEEAGFPVVWINVQVHRWAEPARIFAEIVTEAVDAIQTVLASGSTVEMAADLERLRSSATRLTSAEMSSLADARRLLPEANRVLRSFCRGTDMRLYMFLDDFHYVKRNSQPQLLDLLHGMTRDTDVWLKIATIRNLTRWYLPSEHLGLKTGDDADTIDLDITLSDPGRAKEFLETVLQRFGEHVDISTLSRVFYARALDRLVLASGGVPRDYLTLAAASIRTARGERRKRIGMQDVNSAAGDAAQTKIDELGDDVAAIDGFAETAQQALRDVRQFCLDEKRTTFFRVDVKAKDSHEASYQALASLMDLRLLHLIDPSLSDAHAAGKRYEVFMLDLSQFSGQRLKRAIRTLDFKAGLLVRHETGKPDVLGDTPRRLNTLLRSAPELDLGLLGPQGVD